MSIEQPVVSTGNDSELRSLLTLLDDPDPSVTAIVEARLKSRGRDAIAALSEFAEHSNDPLGSERATQIIRELNEEYLLEAFLELRTKLEERRRGALEDGAFLIARYAYPMLDTEYYRLELDALAGMLHDRIKGIHSPTETLLAINDFFFKTRGFSGNHQQFLDPDNSFLNQVIDRRLGIPITLAVLYLLVTNHRLGLPFSGVSTPGHFLIRFDGIPSEPIFIDAFNAGIVLREADIRKLLAKAGLPYYDTFLRPATARTILLRMLRNLMLIYEERQDEHSKNSMERFRGILLGSPSNEPEEDMAE